MMAVPQCLAVILDFKPEFEKSVNPHILFIVMHTV